MKKYKWDESIGDEWRTGPDGFSFHDLRRRLWNEWKEENTLTLKI